MEITYPENVKKILQIFENNSHSAYIVGGCVRDSLMGKTPDDWDMTTSATPDEMIEIFTREGIRTLPTGLKHGTVSLLLDGEIYECTTYRTEGKYTDMRHPDFVDFTRDIRLDLSRRDFTINAMAHSLSRGLCDIFGGQADLENKLIRAVGDPYVRFSEDALRILRALRFATTLGYDIEPQTLCAVKALSHTLTQISSERKTVELPKILCSDNADRGIKLLFDTGVMPYLLPDISPKSITVTHTDRTLPYRLASLLWECGGKDTSLLCLSNEEKKIIFLSLKPIPYSDTPEGARRTLSDYGEHAKSICILQHRDILSDLLCKHEILSAPVKLKQLDIGGDDLKAIGFNGKAVGNILEYLLDEVLKAPEINNKNTLIQLVISKFSA